MPNLTVTGQAALGSLIQGRLTQLQTALELRKPFWDRMTIDQQRAWVRSGKDPIMSLAWTIYKYLHRNFFLGEGVDG